MVKRLLVTSVAFGAGGGAVIGLVMGLAVIIGGSDDSALEALKGTLQIIYIGAMFGLLIAPVPLVLGTIAARGLRRRGPAAARMVGTVVTLLVTAAIGLALLTGGSYIGSALLFFGGVAIYGAAVAWFRLPWILGATVAE